MVDIVEEVVRLVGARAAAENPDLPEPVSAQTVADAEKALGFALHPLLARLYREVADGGFGPDYRFLPLADGPESVVAEYRAQREPDESGDVGWPEGVVPILEWGCAMYAAVDCRHPHGQVLLFEPNAYVTGWDQAWFEDSETFLRWLAIWLNRDGWYEEDAIERGNNGELRPWPAAAERLGIDGRRV